MGSDLEVSKSAQAYAKDVLRKKSTLLKYDKDNMRHTLLCVLNKTH